MNIKRINLKIIAIMITLISFQKHNKIPQSDSEREQLDANPNVTNSRLEEGEMQGSKEAGSTNSEYMLM